MNISIAKAKKNKLFYFVVTGVIYHPKLKKCLILQRSKKEIAHGGLWGVVGGKLEDIVVLGGLPKRLLKPSNFLSDVWIHKYGDLSNYFKYGLI